MSSSVLTILRAPSSNSRNNSCIAFDDVTSPCVDGGNPAVNPEGEREPNGGRINMGAYGGTRYASMSEWLLAHDTNRDGKVDMRDFARFAEEWLISLPWALK